MQKLLFLWLCCVLFRGATSAGILSQPIPMGIRADILRQRFAPAVRAASGDGSKAKEFDWGDWFWPPQKSGTEPMDTKKYEENWEVSAKSWAGDSRTATLKGPFSLVSKFTAKGTLERARATASIARSKADAAAKAVEEGAGKSEKSTGFVKKGEEKRSKAEEVAIRWEAAAEAWDAAAKSTAAAADGGWTAAGAKTIQIAARQTANIAAAANLKEVAATWRIASASWEGAAAELDPEGLEQKSDAPAELITTTSPDSISISIFALISLFAGSGATFAILRLRHSVSTIGKKSLLANYS